MNLTLIQTVLYAALLAIAHAANEVKINPNYTFDGKLLVGSATVSNLNYNKVLSINWADKNGQWIHSCKGVYGSGPDASNNEQWVFRCPVDDAGITQFYAKYTVNNQDFYDSNGGPGLNYQVTVNQQPPPVAPANGFQADVTAWFSSAVTAAEPYLFRNIHPPGSRAGSVTAAGPNQFQNQTDNIYQFHWTRDSSLVMDVVNTLYKTRSNDAYYEGLLFDYRDLTRFQQTSYDPNTQDQANNPGLDSILGEPKFNLDNGTPYTKTQWCRPQKDGPGLRASTFIHFAKSYLAKHPDRFDVVVGLYNGTNGVIKPDLEYVSQPNVYNFDNGCDLWEETRGFHFYTAMAHRRALVEGAAFARFMGDNGAADWYAKQATVLENTIASKFWNGQAKSLYAIQNQNVRQIDSAQPLAINLLASPYDGSFMTPESDMVLSTLHQLAQQFYDFFPLNRNVKTNSAGLPLGIAVGRYINDNFNGIKSPKGEGNPWYLATLAVAESYYKAARKLIAVEQVIVNQLNIAFFNDIQPFGLGVNVAAGTYPAGSPQYNAIITGLQTLGDLFVRRVAAHTPSDYHLSEEYSHIGGWPMGSQDLTWSYAALFTAKWARDDLIKATAAASASARRRHAGQIAFV
ncbi:glycoside hydrolase 15 protein [Blyttiomyces sp. JEL0837]|nr:glycoside hydrolase 15 protein [Blyttiomyces sp. JEL0837]